MKFRPYFTIRDLFWLTLVVGMAITWRASLKAAHESHENEYRAAISKISQLKYELKVRGYGY